MKFYNPPGGPKRNYNLFKWLGFIYRRLTEKVPKTPANFIIPSQDVLKNLQIVNEKDTATWIGHNTFLLRLNDVTILTDPFFSDYASPIQGVGPKRFAKPALSINQLPPIDIILVTHDHFDHLDLKALADIPNKESIAVVLPLEMGGFFHDLGYKYIHELQWHKSRTIHEITFRALPSYHFCKRNLFFRNTRLWANFMIQTPDKKFFFDGNTAYGSIFLDLGRDYGPFDYAFLSIGAYEPRELMKENHSSPEEAVLIAKELRARTLIPMHWGTITLSDERPFEPPNRFKLEAKKQGFPKENIWIMNIGETRTL